MTSKVRIIRPGKMSEEMRRKIETAMESIGDPFREEKRALLEGQRITAADLAITINGPRGER